MARGLIGAALAAFLLLSAGAVSATESEERALQNQLADRDEYRAKLILELNKRETLLAQQQQVLAKQEQLLQDMYAKLSQPVTEDEEDAQPAAPTKASVGVGGQKLKPDTAQAKRAKDFETQTYKTNLARYNVAHTRKDITDLKALLAHRP
jgi:hypothetical protein